jgi:hypothetical protein
MSNLVISEDVRKKFRIITNGIYYHVERKYKFSFLWLKWHIWTPTHEGRFLYTLNEARGILLAERKNLQARINGWKEIDE